MKRIIPLLLSLLLILSISACGKDAPTWQEQYDLGLRYLSEGNYEEAILAFEAAIEIDPKQADAYLALAEVYTGQGDVGKAAEILERAVAEIGETAQLTAALAAVAPSGEPEPAPEMGLEQKLYEMLHWEGALSYADLPEIFSTPYDQLSGLIGREPYDHQFEMLTEEHGGYSVQDSYTGESLDVDYTLPVRQLGYETDWPEDRFDGKAPFAAAFAPDSSDQLLELTLEGIYGSAGWRDIQLGDTYTTVLEKLSLDTAMLAQYPEVNVTLTQDGQRSNISVSEEVSRYSHTDGSPVLSIGVGFKGDRYTNWMYTISFEFEDGAHLTKVNYHNFGLLVELTAASATEPMPAPEPEPTPAPETDLSRTERTELGGGGYIITEYNRAGKQTSQIMYNADGSIFSHFVWEYDDAGNRIRVINYGYDGSYSVSEYDSQGTNTKQTQYFADGSIDYIYTPEYDDTGRLARNIRYYADGTVKVISEFNANGQEVRRTAYNPDGTVSSVIEF